MRDPIALMRELREARKPFVLATLVASRGHSPQNVGAKLVVTETGLAGGTIGGGKVEARAITEAQAMLAVAGADPKEPEAVLRRWNLQRDVGMSCGGEVEIFFECFGVRDWTIAVCGAGHVAQKLVPLLLTMDCRVVCIDPRADWLAKLPDAERLTKIETEDMASAAAALSSHAFFALMTQGHGYDLPILTRILTERMPPFIGVIGSAAKASTLRRELHEAKVSADRIERLRCPLGLGIGANDPAEIAVSVAAQLLGARDEYFGIKRKSV